MAVQSGLQLTAPWTRPQLCHGHLLQPHPRPAPPVQPPPGHAGGSQACHGPGWGLKLLACKIPRLFCSRWAACRMLSSIWMIWTSSTLPKSGRGNSIYILTSYKDGSIFKVLFLFSSDLLFTPSKKNSFSLISDSLSGNARPRFTRSVSSILDNHYTSHQLLSKIALVSHHRYLIPTPLHKPYDSILPAYFQSDPIPDLKAECKSL